MSLRQSFVDTLAKDMADKLWTANTPFVYRASPQHFSVGSVLPAVMYMFRRGYRRGKGGFVSAFQPNEGSKPDVRWVAWKLSCSTRFEGFDTETKKDILGDLLLCDALENKGGQEGHFCEVQRAFPIHYYASWLDLPKSVADLRFVPEMLVALLANQTGEHVEVSDHEEFTVGKSPGKNPLLRVFHRGVIYGDNTAVLKGDAADRVNENAEFSVEEWLMMQLGRTCEQAPEKLRADPLILTYQPLARRASSIFREDMSALLKCYGQEIPRRALTPMLECSISLGLWHTFFASLNAIVIWERNTELPDLDNCKPFEMFADSSGGTDTRLRELAEVSGLELQRFVSEAAIALAVLRVMDAAARSNPRLKPGIFDQKGIEQWLTLLAAVRKGIHQEAGRVGYSLEDKCLQLLNNLQAGDYSELLGILGSSQTSNDPAKVLADALVVAMGNKLLLHKYFVFLDSAGMSSEPHGMVKKRKVARRLESGKTQRMDARSVVLSNTLLDALVHTLLAKRNGRMSFSEFLGILKSDYGILVDEAPAGVAAEREDLHRNRAILEKRLRDLGLLTGVNDAESMKRLRARYRTSQLCTDHD